MKINSFSSPGRPGSVADSHSSPSPPSAVCKHTPSPDLQPPHLKTNLLLSPSQPDLPPPTGQSNSIPHRPPPAPTSLSGTATDPYSYPLFLSRCIMGI